jgi:NAD(P)-dependent dehydrogenase (short-subunit alcohol dehydrogenase family)
MLHILNNNEGYPHMAAGRVEKNAVFLVSGGARGITAHCVVALAKRYQCKFILLGRSAYVPQPAWAVGIDGEAALKKAIMAEISGRGEKPTPAAIQKQFNSISASREIGETLAAIAQAGGQAEYLAGDVTNAESVRAAAATGAAKFGPITGILHGAGNLADKRIEQKTEKDYETVFAAKVGGLENLLACVPLANLQHLILFSSVAGFFGNVGQADYAIANEILNKAAYLVRRQAPHCRVVAIDWGPWEGGMVTPVLKQYFAQQGVKVIPLDVGAQMLLEELEIGTDAQIVVGGALAFPTAEAANQDFGQLKTHELQRQLSLNENPFLADHVVNSNAVLPMVCAISWIANACEGLYPGYKFFGYNQYKVLKGIVFDETLASHYTLTLRETHKDAEQITFEATISSKTSDGKLRYHYKADPILVRQKPSAPHFGGVDLTPSANLEGLPLYEQKVIFHGWSFRGVKRILNMSEQKTTMQCHLAPVPLEYQGQFPCSAFNLYAVDVALQSMGLFARLTYEMGSLPLQTGKAEVYREIPFGQGFYVTLEPRHITPNSVNCDLNIHDADGGVYIRVYASEITLSKRLIDMFFLNTLATPIPYREIASKPAE